MKDKITITDAQVDLIHEIVMMLVKAQGWVNPPQREDVRLVLQAQLLLKREKKLKKEGKEC